MVENKTNEVALLRVFSVSGTLMNELYLQPGSNSVVTNEFSSGLYFYNITGKGNGKSLSGKIIKLN